MHKYKFGSTNSYAKAWAAYQKRKKRKERKHAIPFKETTSVPENTPSEDLQKVEAKVRNSN